MLLPHYQQAKSALDGYAKNSNVLVLTLSVTHSSPSEDDGMRTRRCLGVEVDSVDGADGGGGLRVAVPDNGLQPLGLDEVLEWLPEFRIEAATDSFVVLRRLKPKTEEGVARSTPIVRR